MMLRHYALPSVGGVLLLLIGVEVWLPEPGALQIGWEELQPFVWLNCLGAAVYFGAVALVLTRPAPKWSLAVVLTMAAAMRIGPLIERPLLSSDIYRYVWDGRVQAQGINPYIYRPAAPELAFLRDPVIYPNVNRAASAPTIYPPAAQVIFAAVGQVWPAVAGVKLAMAGFDCLTIGCLVALLRRARLPPARVLIYAWNPLVVWEFSGNGHIDAASAGLIALAWLLASRAGTRALVGAVMGLAILCKFLPAAIYPAFWRRWDWRMLLGTGAVAAGLYALYIGAGWKLLGYLPGYADEEGLSTGNGFFLLRVLATVTTLPPNVDRIYIGAALLMLAGLAGWFALGSRPLADPAARVMEIGRQGAVLAAATMVLISPHYPWYLCWLAMFACVAPYRSVMWLAGPGVLLYLDPYRDIIAFPAIVYGPCLALAVLDIVQNRAARRAARGDRPCPPRY